MGKSPDSAAHTRNRLLLRLPPLAFQRLQPHLEAVSLEPKQLIYKVRATLDYVYFPATGIISAMTVMEDGTAIEVATIGNEGMAGLTSFVGGETSPYEVLVQIPGDGWRMPAEELARQARDDGPLRQLLVRYHTAFAVQVSYSVACNGLHTVEKRCCRWLLTCQDRVGSNVQLLTHEFLSIMLGVRRASVTEVLRPLQERGLIHNGRGKIEIVDRAGLEALACECYRAVTEEYNRLLG